MIARQIVDAAEISPEEKVLEIGGGLGILTRWLAQAAKRVFVIEISRGLAHALTERFGSTPNVHIIRGDALRVPLPRVEKVVSNLPYNISSKITFRLIREVPFRAAVLMFQEEFARRLLAAPGSREYSRLTIDVRYAVDVEEVLHVPAEKFYPKPSVDSLVVRLRPRERGPFARDEDVFYYTVKSLFIHPNKRTEKAMKLWLKNIGLDSGATEHVLSACHEAIQGAERVRHLSLEEIVKLSDIITDLIEAGVIPDPRRQGR